MKREFLTVSNLLSVSRALLVIPFAVVMLPPGPPERVTGAIFLALAALTDKLDGVFARKFHQETEWGRILDPLADKVGVAAVALILLRLGDIPLWFVAALLSRDLLIFAGGMYIKATRGMVLPSNQTGKWAVGVVSVVLFLGIVGAPPSVIAPFLWASAAVLLASFLLYAKRFVITVSSKAR